MQTRENSIPDDAVKVTPATDLHPPVVHSREWEAPVPLAGPINTAGVEDAPVVSPDGRTLLFFFTPDARVPAGEQAGDGISGVWETRLDSGACTDPARVVLSAAQSLDAPFALSGDTLWFGSFRAGNHRDDGDIWTTVLRSGSWTAWQNAGARLNRDYNLGELAVAGRRIIFDRRSDETRLDLWSTSRADSGWATPVSLGSTINSAWDEGQPAISPDGEALWFTRITGIPGYEGPALLRALRSGDAWGPPVELISNFAGDAAVDERGDIYFTHVFAGEDHSTIEADIYVARRRR